MPSLRSSTSPSAQVPPLGIRRDRVIARWTATKKAKSHLTKPVLLIRLKYRPIASLVTTDMVRTPKFTYPPSPSYTHVSTNPHAHVAPLRHFTRLLHGGVADASGQNQRRCGLHAAGSRCHSARNVRWPPEPGERLRFMLADTRPTCLPTDKFLCVNNLSPNVSLMPNSHFV